MKHGSHIFDEDLNLITAVCDLAECPTSTETPGVADDHEFDALIMAARVIKAREGFDVVSIPANSKAMIF